MTNQFYHTQFRVKPVLKVLENSYIKGVPENALLHSDRGTQFTSLEYKQTLDKLKVTHSMSRVGKCIDNGPMEGFFGNLSPLNYRENNKINVDN